MNSNALITKDTLAPKMSFVEREKLKLLQEIEELKANLPEQISKEQYEEAKTKLQNNKNKTISQDIIDKYEKQTEIKKEIESKERELTLLEPFLASIDCGKYNTKFTYCLDNPDIFTSNIFESRVQRSTECTHDTGKKFFVGSQSYSMSGSAKRVSDRNAVTNSDIEPMPNSKAHEYHRVLLLKALYKVYLETGRRVFDVGVGTSIDNYIEDEGAKVYLAMLDEKLPQDLQKKVDSLKSKKEINDIYKAYAKELKNKFISKEFVVRETGSKPVTLVINDLFVVPETVSGASMVNVDENALIHAYIIDLGGLNESYLPIVNYAPSFDNVITTKTGMAHKYEEIASWIVTKSSDVTSMDREGVEVRLKNRNTMLTGDIEELIKDYMFEYLDRLTNKLKTSRVALQEGVTSLIFIGGGSQVLAPYIKDYYSNRCDIQGKLHVAEEDGIFANVTGIYEASVNYFDDRKYEKEEMLSKVC